MLSGLNESKGSNEEEYWQACVLLSAALIAVVISFSFSLFSSPMWESSILFKLSTSSKTAGNIREG